MYTGPVFSPHFFWIGLFVVFLIHSHSCSCPGLWIYIGHGLHGSLFLSFSGLGPMWASRKPGTPDRGIGTLSRSLFLPPLYHLSFQCCIRKCWQVFEISLKACKFSIPKSNLFPQISFLLAFQTWPKECLLGQSKGTVVSKWNIVDGETLFVRVPGGRHFLDDVRLPVRGRCVCVCVLHCNGYLTPSICVCVFYINSCSGYCSRTNFPLHQANNSNNSTTKYQHL